MVRKSVSAISRATAIIIVVILIIVVVVGAYYYASSQTPSTKTSVVFGIPVKGSYQFMPVYYAANNSYFSNNGLDATVQAFTGDASLSTAISSGAIQIGMDNIFSVEHFISANLPIKIVAQVTTANDFVVIVNANSHYQKPSDLNGAKIGVTSIPGLTYQLAKNFASNNSLTLTPAALGGLSTQLAALQQNQSQAFIWTFEEGYNLQALGQGRILANLSSYYPSWNTEMVIFASNSMIQNHSSTVQKVLKSVFQAINGIKANQAQAATFLGSFLNMQSAAATNTIQRAVGIFSSDGTINAVGVGYAITFDVSGGLITGTPPVASDSYTTQFTPVPT